MDQTEANFEQQHKLDETERSDLSSISKLEAAVMHQSSNIEVKQRHVARRR